ncbi:hypothetical protein [Stenotrophomonas phage BUCTxx100]|nr:hypothetical protein [Stenotrophomonas phage BUCTxx100]
MTLPTQNPIPSSSITDQLFNAEKIDQVVNSDDLQYTDRFGRTRFTFAGLYNIIQTWLGSLANPDGAANIGLRQGGTVQSEIRTVSLESCGAVGDGVTDDTLAFNKAAATGFNLVLGKNKDYLVSQPALLPFVTGYQKGARRYIEGNGSTIITTGAYEPFNQYVDEAKSGTRVIKYGWNFYNLNFKGFGSKDGEYNVINKADAISFAYGEAVNISGIGLNNVLRAYGMTLAKNIYGDDLRNALYSCYLDPIDNLTGKNTILNSRLGWSAGEGLILKGTDIYVDGFMYDYAGCISPNSIDDINAKAQGKLGTNRGSGISCGADDYPASNVTITNVTGKFYGAAGLSLNGDNINVGGSINVGSVYTDNLVPSLTGSALSCNIRNSYIGKVKAGNVFGGMGLNAHSNNFTIAGFECFTKQTSVGAIFFSAGDTADNQITKGHIGDLICHGQLTINDDFYFNTAGIIIDNVHLGQINNQQGGYLIKIQKAGRIGKFTALATTSTANNTCMYVGDNAIFGELNFENIYGTCLEVKADAVPVIGNLNIRGKKGTLPPIIINGTGAASLNWGNVKILGTSTASPKLNGQLTMDSYTGPDWVIATTGVAASVSFPTRTSTNLT